MFSFKEKEKSFTIYGAINPIEVVIENNTATAYFKDCQDTLAKGDLIAVLKEIEIWTQEEALEAERMYEEMASHTLDTIEYKALLRGQGFGYRKY